MGTSGDAGEPPQARVEQSAWRPPTAWLPPMGPPTQPKIGHYSAGPAKERGLIPPVLIMPILKKHTLSMGAWGAKGSGGAFPQEHQLAEGARGHRPMAAPPMPETQIQGQQSVTGRWGAQFVQQRPPQEEPPLEEPQRRERHAVQTVPRRPLEPIQEMEPTETYVPEIVNKSTQGEDRTTDPRSKGERRRKKSKCLCSPLQGTKKCVER